MKALWIFFFITLISMNTHAQDPQLPRQIYFFLGVGLPIMKIKDEGHSPLKYQGWIPTMRLSPLTCGVQRQRCAAKSGDM